MGCLQSAASCSGPIGQRFGLMQWMRRIRWCCDRRHSRAGCPTQPQGVGRLRQIKNERTGQQRATPLEDLDGNLLLWSGQQQQAQWGR